MLAANNFTDAALQDAVAVFVTQNQQSRQILRDTTQKLAAAMSDGATTDAQLTALLTDWRVSKAAEETRHQSALKALDAKINFSANPRLEALLLLSGIAGEAPMGGPGGFGGRGRFGGPPGGDN